MSARRQRIKATANLTQIKRKPRKDDAEPKKQAEPAAVSVAHAKQQESFEEATNEVAFKMPAVSSTGQFDDVFHSDIEDNVIQMDLQRTANGYPMSPSKAQARQRVRPTPVFGQRRNSFVGSPLAPDYEGEYQSPGTPTKRERYLSGSSTNMSGTQQQTLASPKYVMGSVTSPGVGRIRTESTCSAYSDSGVGKQRKGEGDKSQSQAQHRVNAKRDFEIRFNKGIPDKSTFKMFDMIFYNPLGHPMEPKQIATTIKAESLNSGTNNTDEAKPTTTELPETKPEPAATAIPVPQLKLDANGEMIIDEKTLEIETTAEVEARKVLANSSLILMDETTGDNGFYKRHKRTSTWSADDTVRFYRSLQIIGTDFSLMCQMFPKRTRRDLKLKYKREERINGPLINKALLYPKAFNVQELKDQLDREDRERAEKDQQLRDIFAAQIQIPKKRAKSQCSKAARALSGGDLVYENELVTKEKFGKHALAKRCAELTEKNDQPPVKRRRRVLKQKLDVPVITLHQEEQQQMEPDAEQSLPITTLPGFSAIKREKNIKREQSQPLLQSKAEELQGELNSLLSEDPLEAAIELDDGNRNYANDGETANTSATETYTIDFIDDAASATPEDKDGINERDVEAILNELADGSMALVSSLDPSRSESVINEIYMYDKDTGELFDHPLAIPQHIVQSILKVVT